TRKLVKQDDLFCYCGMMCEIELISGEHQGQRMAPCGPAVMRIRDRKIDDGCIGPAFYPRRARNFFTSEQVVLYTRKNAPPVTTVKCFVNHASDFNIHPVAGQNLVVYKTEQFQ